MNSFNPQIPFEFKHQVDLFTHYYFSRSPSHGPTTPSHHHQSNDFPDNPHPEEDPIPSPDAAHSSQTVIFVRLLPRLLGIMRSLPRVLRYAKLRAPKMFGKVMPELLVSRKAIQAQELLGMGDILTHQKRINQAVTFLTWAFITSDVYLALIKIPGIHIPGAKHHLAAATATPQEPNNLSTPPPFGEAGDASDAIPLSLEDEELLLETWYQQTHATRPWYDQPWKPIAQTIFDRVIFHALATIYLPTWILESVHKVSSIATSSSLFEFLHRFPKTRILLPSLLTAATIPLIVDPVCDATDWVMNKSIRRCYYE